MVFLTSIATVCKICVRSSSHKGCNVSSSTNDVSCDFAYSVVQFHV